MKCRNHVLRGRWAAFAALILGIIVLLAGFAWLKMAPQRRVSKTVVEASCTEPGYVMTYDPASGTNTVENLPALGHSFGAWAAEDGTGMQKRACTRCGVEEKARISSVPDDLLPELRLTGSLDGIGKKVKVPLKAKFSGMGEDFECYAIMTLQGHSTYGHPKRNYTVRFYEDDQSVVKHKLQFNTWNREHKYILKANYIDVSQCRNLIGARIWSSMAACRNGLPARIAALPTYGAVDGFPVDVYLNGEYFGLYMMNLHKDDDLYQMKEGERAALVICNQQTTDEALFRDKAAFLPDYSSDWEIEFCGTADETWAQDSFNQLIDFVMNSPDDRFSSQLSDYLDVDAAVDYLLFIYALGLQHSGAKDLVMLNYGDVWIPSAYDMDEAFGLNANDAAYLAPDEFIPVQTDGVWSSGTGSLLWDRLLNAYFEEICSRYAFLRRDVLSQEKVIAMVEEFVGGIPEMRYDMDMNCYPDRPIQDMDMKTQITDYIVQRFDVLDAILGGNGK